ncbi:chaperone modulator CbpM [Sphingomonas faeni]|uniref:chaperone modulator CbpM n=1 Tax=Sphingomonas faeni TaxID=185950 RepID=UPI0020C78276|nr:chaperone modulator CbpM [Sphingomonas faeni]MCP8891627.1 chaperone modulator CbpM [Sphingomonas faeni]
MISFDVLIARTAGLCPVDLHRWISNKWVRPDGDAGHYAFHEIDVARVRLIFELRDDLDVNEAALPVVLSLLDQLYDARRRMRELGDALGDLAPAPLRQALIDRLSGPNAGSNA